MDENSSCYGWVTDVTYQWCIFGEARANGQNHAHAKGFLASGGPPYPDRLSFHHNLFAHNPDRSPKIQYATADIRNNVIYNWHVNNSSKFFENAKINLVNNIYKKGRNSSASFNDVAWLKTGAARTSGWSNQQLNRRFADSGISKSFQMLKKIVLMSRASPVRFTSASRELVTAMNESIISVSGTLSYSMPSRSSRPLPLPFGTGSVAVPAGSGDSKGIALIE